MVFAKLIVLMLFELQHWSFDVAKHIGSGSVVCQSFLQKVLHTLHQAAFGLKSCQVRKQRKEQSQATEKRWIWKTNLSPHCPPYIRSRQCGRTSKYTNESQVSWDITPPIDIRIFSYILREGPHGPYYRLVVSVGQTQSMSVVSPNNYMLESSPLFF